MARGRGGFSGGGRGGGGSFGGRSGGMGSFGGPGRAGGRPPAYRPPAPVSRRPVVVRPSLFGWGMMGMGRRRRGGMGPGGGGGGGHGCGLNALAPIIAIGIILIIFYYLGGFGGSQEVTRSTVQREPLPGGHVIETGYYTDELGWVNNSTRLTNGMRNFYRRTGVQPHLFITDTIPGADLPMPANAQGEAFAKAKYSELFEDEAHLLLVFYERNETPAIWYHAGSLASTVLDTEAMDILQDYLVRYYYDRSLDTDQYFSKAFDDASKRIMSVTRSPWIPVLIIAGVIAVLLILLAWWKKRMEQRNLEAEQTERILNTPIETLGDDEAARLAREYEKDSDQKQ